MAETEISIAVVRVQAELADFRKEMKTMGPAAAAAGEDIAKVFAQKLRQVQRDHQTTANVAKKASEDAANAAAAAANKTSRSWNDVAKKMQSNQMISDMEQLGGMFILVGGNVSKMAMLFTSAVRPVAMLSEILGPTATLALGLAAIPVAALAAASAASALNNAVVDLGRDAVKLKDDVVGIVPKEVSFELENMAANFEASDRAAKALSATLAAKLAPEIEKTSDLLLGFTVIKSGILEGLEDIKKEGEDALGEKGLKWYAALATNGTSVLSDAIAGLGEAEREAAQGNLANVLDDIAKKTDKAGGALGSWREQYDKQLREVEASWDDVGRAADRSAQKQVEAAKKAEIEAKRLAQEQATDMSALIRLMDETQSKTLSTMDAINAKYQERIQKISELKISTEDAERAMALAEERRVDDVVRAIDKEQDRREKANKDALVDAERFYREMNHLADEMDKDSAESLKKKADQIRLFYLNVANQFSQAVGEIVSVLNQRISDAMSATQDSIARARENIDRWRDSIDEAYAQWEADSQAFTKADAIAARDLANMKIAQNQRVIAEQQAGLKKQQTQAQIAFVAQQSLAAAQVIMQGAATIMGMAAQLSLVMPPPSNMVTAAQIGGALIATQLAAIAAVPAPEFPMGGMTSPDHRLVGVRGDEGILTPRGLRGVGGEKGLEQLNSGMGSLNSSAGSQTKILREIRDLLRPSRGGGVVTAVRGRRG